jgi:hypothetical protein
VTEELCGISFSKSLVSHLSSSLDAELEAWRKRPLEAEAYPYVFVDARGPTRRSGWVGRCSARGCSWSRGSGTTASGRYSAWRSQTPRARRPTTGFSAP